MSFYLFILFSVPVLSFFESYEGSYAQNEKHVTIYPISYRLSIETLPKNYTNSTIQSITGNFSYITVPTTLIQADPFQLTGLYFKQKEIIFFLYSKDPVIRFQKAEYARRMNLFTSYVSSLHNFSLSQQHLIHSGYRNIVLNETQAKNYMTYVFHRKCFNNSCKLFGTHTDSSRHIYYTLLQQYSQSQLNKDWRIYVTFYAIAVFLRTFAFLHFYSSPLETKPLSPPAILMMVVGDIAHLILFRMQRNHYGNIDHSVFSFIFYYSLITTSLLGYQIVIYAQQANSHLYSVISGSIHKLSFMYIFHMLLFVYSIPYYSMFLRFSYLFPQIFHSALLDAKKTINLLFLTIMIISQLSTQFLLVYYHKDRPYYIPNLSQYMKTTIIYISIQYFIVILQTIFGGGFFVPESFRPSRYNYNGEKPPPNTECAICLMNINENEPSYCTPCHHFFHQECLSRWMEEGLICPICRTRIPALDESVH